jgi:hypothetical protein
MAWTDTIDHFASILKLLDRAEKEGLQAYMVDADPSEWVVTSSEAEVVAYRVRLFVGTEIVACCSCPAGETGCKHSVLVLHKLGQLDF